MLANRLRGLARDNYALAVLADIPAAWWRVDETSGSTAADSSGNGLTGDYGTTVTLNQSPLIVSGKSISVAGASSGDEAIDAPDIAVSTAMTAEMWINIASAPGATRTLMAKAKSGTFAPWLVQIGTDGKISVTLRYQNSSAGEVSLTSPGSVANGARHQIGFAWDKSGDQKVHMYVDGAQVAESAAWNRTILAGSGHRTLVYTSGSETIQFDEISVYTSFLSASRMDAHYDAGVG